MDAGIDSSLGYSDRISLSLWDTCASLMVPIVFIWYHRTSLSPIKYRVGSQVLKKIIRNSDN